MPATAAPSTLLAVTTSTLRPFWLFSRLRRRPLTDDQKRTLQTELPFVASMPDGDRERFHRHVELFLQTKRIEGIGIDVTDDMRLVIAGCAARLSRNLDFSLYDGISSVVVYPTAVEVPGLQRGPTGYDVDDKTTAAHGVHLSQGAVVLSWAAVAAGLRNTGDGHDTALHEFAHAIDARDGGHDGTPPLSVRASREWARVFAPRFRALQDKPWANVMRAYGATNEAEFFAVAAETFFEKPNALRRKAPDLYAALAGYFDVDPAAR